MLTLTFIASGKSSKVMEIPIEVSCFEELKDEIMESMKLADKARLCYFDWDMGDCTFEYPEEYDSFQDYFDEVEDEYRKTKKTRKVKS